MAGIGCSHLRLLDVRRVFNLIGEIRDLEGRSLLQRQRVIDGSGEFIAPFPFTKQQVAKDAICFSASFEKRPHPGERDRPFTDRDRDMLRLFTIELYRLYQNGKLTPPKKDFYLSPCQQLDYLVCSQQIPTVVGWPAIAGAGGGQILNSG